MDHAKKRITYPIFSDPSFVNITQELTDVYEGINDSVDFVVIELPQELAIHKMLKDSCVMVVSDRLLSKDESNNLSLLNRKCRDYQIGFDALAFLGGEETKDTIIDLDKLKLILNGKDFSHKLVFDQNYSAAVTTLSSLVKGGSLASTSVAAKDLSNLVEVINADPKLIGVCGSNLFSNLDDSSAIKLIHQVKVLGIRNNGAVNYPFQADLAAKKYPIARDIFILNSEHFYGPYSAFKNFVIGPKGQRIILKSGLLPFYMPTRQLNFVKGK